MVFRLLLRGDLPTLFFSPMPRKYSVS